VWVQDRKGLNAFMRMHNVECEAFWTTDYSAAPLDNFPFERSLRQHVTILSIHQGLTANDMITMANLLNRWNQMA